MFSFYELLARPELIDDMKPPVTNSFTSSGILDNIIRPLMSPKPKPLKPRKRLSSSCKSLDSNGRGEMRMKTNKSSSICSSESLNHATSETSLESSSVDDHPTAPNHCSLLEFLLEPPPPSYLAPSSDLTRTSSFLSLQSVAKDYKDYNDFNDYNDLFSNQPFSQNFGKKPIYGTKQLYRNRAKSDEDLMQECSLAEFLSTPHLNLAPKKQSIGSGIFGGFSLAKSLRQLSLGSVSLEKSFTVSEILALRRVSDKLELRFVRSFIGLHSLTDHFLFDLQTSKQNLDVFIIDIINSWHIYTQYTIEILSMMVPASRRLSAHLCSSRLNNISKYSTPTTTVQRSSWVT